MLLACACSEPIEIVTEQAPPGSDALALRFQPLPALASPTHVGWFVRAPMLLMLGEDGSLIVIVASYTFAEAAGPNQLWLSFPGQVEAWHQIPNPIVVAFPTAVDVSVSDWLSQFVTGQSSALVYGSPEPFVLVAQLAIQPSNAENWPEDDNPVIVVPEGA